jgi:PEP-CTERM motif-containing protein
MKRPSVLLFVSSALMVALSLCAGAEAVPVSVFQIQDNYRGPIDFHINGAETAQLYPIIPPTNCFTAPTCNAAAFPPGVPGAVPGGTSGAVNAQVLGESGWGVFNVSNITAAQGGSLPFGTILWQDGTNGEHLSGIFWNVADFQVNTGTDGFGNATQHFFSTGTGAAGFVGNPTDIQATVYLRSTNGSLGTPADRTGTNTFTGISDGAGTSDFLDLHFVPGASGTVPAAELATFLTPANVNSQFGGGTGFADVVGGNFAQVLNKDRLTTNIGTPADLALTFDTLPAGNPSCNGTPAAPCSPWTVDFNDPVRGFVPEPSAVILLGASLLGLVALRGRRRR